MPSPQRQRLLQSAPSNLATPWWQAGGVTGALEAHRAKGAASLAASYANLVTPGTHDAIPTVAPTWNAGTGWTFNGTTQYLTTDITPLATYSMLAQFSGATGDGGYVCGESQGDSTFFLILPRYSDVNHYYGNGGLTPVSGRVTSGNLAVVGTKGYKDGAFEIDIGAGAFPSFPIFIGCRNRNNTASDFYAGNVQGYVLFDHVLTAPETLAVATAMAGFA